MHGGNNGRVDIDKLAFQLIELATRIYSINIITYFHQYSAQASFSDIR